MFKGPVDPEKYLYHYTTREIALEEILYSRLLKLSPFKATHDPRESKFWIFDFPGSHHLTPEERIDLQIKVNDKIKERCNVLCLTRDDQVKLQPDFDPFGRGFGRARMWAQYAGKHTGICLIFDKEPLIEAIEDKFDVFSEIYHGSVKYVDRSEAFSDAFCIDYGDMQKYGHDFVIKKHIREHYKTFFLKKVTDWETEFEYRVLLIGDDNSPAYVPIDDSIRGIVIGYDFPNGYKCCIREICDKYGIQAAKIEWPNGHPVILEDDRLWFDKFTL